MTRKELLELETEIVHIVYIELQRDLTYFQLFPSCLSGRGSRIFCSFTDTTP